MSKIIKFLNEVVYELASVKWPTRRDLLVYGFIVCCMVFISAIIVSIMDIGFNFLVQSIIKL